MKNREEDLSTFLPTEAVNRGWQLIWEPPVKIDPVLLLTQHGKELHRWDYTPSLGEVLEACQKEDIE